VIVWSATGEDEARELGRLIRSSRALTPSGVGEKGGARLLGRAAVRPFDNIINHLKNRLHVMPEAEQ
jgi:hypothetical protein